MGEHYGNINISPFMIQPICIIFQTHINYKLPVKNLLLINIKSNLWKLLKGFNRYSYMFNTLPKLFSHTVGQNWSKNGEELIMIQK